MIVFYRCYCHYYYLNYFFDESGNCYHKENLHLNFFIAVLIILDICLIYKTDYLHLRKQKNNFFLFVSIFLNRQVNFLIYGHLRELVQVVSVFMLLYITVIDLVLESLQVLDPLIFVQFSRYYENGVSKSKFSFG